jgi:hypothetical protein
MNMAKRILRFCGFVFLGLGFVWACGFDDTLREYLSAHFWLPFAKRPANFEKPNVRRVSEPYAGMTAAENASPLAKLRAAYQQVSKPESISFDPAELQPAVTAARADQSLTRRQKEEVTLIDAKIDMRAGQPDEPQLLESAKKKLEVFLRTARTPEFLSEARGWLAHIHYLLGDQTAAGKIYLDELNRNGSNLSRETLLNSLQMTYGYDGGQGLLDNLDEYFDTPEHAAFAIQLVTNPHWHRYAARFERADDNSKTYARIKDLLEKHNDLLRSNPLAVLSMRTALRMGDPPEARRIAEAVPANAAIRAEPDFNWMLASAHFLSREYAAAEQPLRALFRSPRASNAQRAAAAYGLCGVYRKIANVPEQLRFALWLHKAAHTEDYDYSMPAGLADLSVYWAESGWDLNLLLEAEAPIEALQSFVNQNPNLPDIRLVKYSLAVRLARENRYEEAADLYQSIHAVRRAPRMRQLAVLYQEATRTDLEAKYKMAEFLIANPSRIYFNDALWEGFQRYAFQASTDSRLTRAERKAQIDLERKLKDDQDERWRAYLILRDVVRDGGQTDLGRKAAALGVRCLLGISERFERQQEIRKATIELSRSLRR